MKYEKNPLSFEQQADLMISRGFEGDKNKLSEYLSKVNYYRLSGYLYPFRSGDKENFKSGTTLQLISEIYDFDTDLRLLTLAAIEKIEVAILRTRMVERFSLLYGSFCYLEHKNFGSKISPGEHTDLIARISETVDKSNEEFVERYWSKYTSEKHLPFWMVAEACSLGQLSQIFRDLQRDVIVPLSREFGLHSTTLVSWIHTLSVVRNICAHHSRLWNRVLRVKPLTPSEKYRPEFFSPRRIPNNRFFIILAILEYTLGLIYPDISFARGFSSLLKQYPGVPINMMGIPEEWQEYSVFKAKN